MRLLWIATKPPLPPVDGGRLVTAATLNALGLVGVEIELVTPVPSTEETHPTVEQMGSFCRVHRVPVRTKTKTAALLRAILARRPFSIERHEHEEVRHYVHDLLQNQRYDAVHVEQVQALAQAEPALRRRLPVVLRAQNVESDLWLWPDSPVGRWMAGEAKRLAAFERRAVRRVPVTVALSQRDASRLRELAGVEEGVVAVPPPFPATLPTGDRRLPGAPPLILMGSSGWLPNRDANRWFLSTVWPEVRGRVPNAALHLFAPESERPSLSSGVTAHAPPADSGDALAPGGILVVPLRVGSGVRMKILEAWARGLCVVATPEAVAGLEAEDGRELLVARDAAGFAAAIRRLADDGGLRERLVTAGRRALAEHHDPETVARRLLALYAAARG
ncbi:MAG: glycosyltransferase family 4 protein [Thermoanaerobaculia bacterium]